ALPAHQEGKTGLGVLFMVPEDAALQAKSMLEGQGLPYVVKPFHLHDFLERVSDLLMETESISAPIRRVRQEFKLTSRFEGLASAPGSAGRRSAPRARNTMMFANPSEYSMTEEEIAEYERAEADESARRKKKKLNSDGF